MDSEANLSPDQALDRAFNEWRKRLPKRLELYCEKDRAKSVQPVCMSFGRSILDWCKKNNEQPEHFYSKIASIEEFASNLYQSLTHQDGEKPKRWSIWRHADLDQLVTMKTKQFRDNYADWNSLKQ